MKLATLKVVATQNIRYPFHIQETPPSFCGYPDFGVSCGVDGFPILNLFNTKYIIRQIFYKNNSFRVFNADFSRPSTNTGCRFASTQNLNIPPINRFHVAPNQKGVLLLHGCNLSSLPRGMGENRLGCSAENRTSSVITLDKGDKNASLIKKSCNGGEVDVMVGAEVAMAGRWRRERVAARGRAVKVL